MNDDMALVREYAVSHSESAFAALVAHYIALVHTAAMRQVGDAHLAQDITQAVFIILARKAGSLGPDTILSAWLYRTTGYVAAETLRTRRRRALREHEAYMHSTINEPQSGAWERISPLLDEAMAGLSERDRSALVLRFFENKTASEIAAALKVNEEAAQKRVTRALEKLKRAFGKRGVGSTTAIIAEAIAANSVQAAPAGLAATVMAVTAKGATAGSSTLTLIKGALKLMAWTKVKSGMMAGVVIILATGATTVAVKQYDSRPLNESMWALDPHTLMTDPPVVALRPSHGGYARTTSTSTRMVAHAVSLAALMSYAYGPPTIYFKMSGNRVILAPDVADGKFDFLLTVPHQPQEALRAEIKKQLGLVAHREMREADIQVLKVSNPSLIESMVAKSGPGSTRIQQNGFSFSGESIDILTDFLEDSLGMPVIDKTGLTQKYSGNLKWDPQSDKTAKLHEIQNALSDQLGLELGPSRQSIEFLVVEKAK